ncbi:MAG: glycine cleavage system protein GcvH [Saprospiraceae bacterium]|nr:glycine cleavage system protein GcvH [Saprospiraceae bacterium]
MNLPAKLKYTNEHEWIKIDPEVSTDDQTVAIIGITDFAQQELGELVYVEVETVGEQLAKDEVFGTVEAVKTTSDLFMPVAGKVIAFNPELNEAEGDNPGMVNEEPYASGWIIKIALDNPADLEGLLSAEDYQAVIS